MDNTWLVYRGHLASLIQMNLTWACCMGADMSMQVLQEEMAKYRDLEYCKVDLIASKGIVFCKYVKSSSALLALEAIIANDNLVRLCVTHA